MKRILKTNFIRIQAYYTLLILFVTTGSALAQNPVIRDQYSADPSARVFDGKVYVYPSHDILATEGRGRAGWFCMEDYHVFSSTDLIQWTDHGVILDQYRAGWVDTLSFSMWAPDCVEKDGMYYFYYPAIPRAESGKGFGIGVAVANRPEGPFDPLPEPIAGVKGIDPCVFIDSDGQAYLYYSLNKIYVARLNDDMKSLASEPLAIENLPTKGLIEGPWLFERKGLYYLTYPHVEKNVERLEYATGPHPLGPFTFKGVIMDESPTGCWTNHQSITEYKGQWYLFYHHNDYSPAFDKNRSVRIDSLFFEEDGSIRKVIPSLRGVGISNAGERTDPDRYSAISENGASIEFLDSTNRFKGWKVVFNEPGAWVRYNRIDFSEKAFRTVEMMAASEKGGMIEVREAGVNGPVLANIKIPSERELASYKIRLKRKPAKITDLYIVNRSGKTEVDWMQFH